MRQVIKKYLLTLRIVHQSDIRQSGIHSFSSAVDGFCSPVETHSFHSNHNLSLCDFHSGTTSDKNKLQDFYAILKVLAILRLWIRHKSLLEFTYRKLGQLRMPKPVNMKDLTRPRLQIKAMP